MNRKKNPETEDRMARQFKKTEIGRPAASVFFKFRNILSGTGIMPVKTWGVRGLDLYGGTRHTSTYPAFF
jgi:hypothetical protein